MSNIEVGWGVPGRVDFLRSLAAHARLIQFDKRGTGMSDPVRDSPTLEVRMDDVRAVMDAAGSERAALLGVDSGGAMSAVFAATYPDRTAGLVLFGTSARTLWAPDHPWGPTEQEHIRTIDRYERFWGTSDLVTDILREYSPSVVPDEDTIRMWASYLRQSASPGTIAAFERMNMLIDVRGVLPAIHVPTLVVATAIVDAVRALGLEVRAGLHTGECEQVGGKVGGIAVHIGARVADAARPGEVLVSGTVKDLVAGSELEFDEREAAELKGVPGEWRLYAVRS